LIPPNTLKKIELHLRIARDHLGAFDDALRVAAAAECRSSRLAADVRDDRPPSTWRAPRPFPQMPTSPRASRKVTPFSQCERLERGRCAGVAHLGDVGMPEERCCRRP